MYNLKNGRYHEHDLDPELSLLHHALAKLCPLSTELNHVLSTLQHSVGHNVKHLVVLLTSAGTMALSEFQLDCPLLALKSNLICCRFTSSLRWWKTIPT